MVVSSKLKRKRGRQNWDCATQNPERFREMFRFRPNKERKSV